MLCPILHHHRDTCRAAPIFLLRNKWDVEPQAGEARGNCDGAYRQRSSGSDDITYVQHDRQPLVHSDDDQDQNGDAEENDQQIMIVQRAGGEVSLCFLGARRQLGQLLIAESGNCRFHLFRVDVR